MNNLFRRLFIREPPKLNRETRDYEKIAKRGDKVLFNSSKNNSGPALVGIVQNIHSPRGKKARYNRDISATVHVPLQKNVTTAYVTTVQLTNKKSVIKTLK